MSKRVNVTAIPDGPFKLTGVDTLTFCGKPLDAPQGDVFLCRCGQSKNAPFCDGAHQAAGFKGANEARPPKDVVVWEGDAVRTHFNPNVCMHVFKCQPLKELRERELTGDTDAAEEIMRVVNLCPSGALSYETKGSVEEPTRIGADEVEVMEGGEIRIQCAFDINADLGERQPKDRGTLCRCGLSKNKPWCDGRHKSKKDFR